MMSSLTNTAQVQWVLPFALPLPNLPPRSTAFCTGLGSRPCLPDPREEGDGTPGPCTGGPRPPTASPRPVAAPKQADVGTPQEAGVLWPRNQLGAPERARAPPSGRGGVRTEDPGNRTSRRPSRSRCRSWGGRRRVPRAGRGGRGGGGRPVLTRAGAVHPGAGALRAGGSWRAGGRGAGLTSPRSPEAAERL